MILSQADEIMPSAFIAIKNAHFLQIFFFLNTDLFFYHRVVVKWFNTFELFSSSDILSLKNNSYLILQRDNCGL